MTLRLYDAHNHLQDERLTPGLASILEVIKGRHEIQAMVVNGCCEEDWPKVLALARMHPQVIPSFGCHPWYVAERTEHWQKTLENYLGQIPSGIGEIGLDRWIRNYDSERQEEAFSWQLQLAAKRQLPVSIHCLHAWGRMLELLQLHRLPGGFVFHSFGGPREMIPAFAELGAYFSLPGYFAHERKHRQREAFLAVPPDRLLIETDAPDQPLPEERTEFPLQDAVSGKSLNHPANLGAVYRFAAELYGQPLERLAERVETNFKRLFGPLLRR